MTATRTTKSFSLDRALLKEVDRTKGSESTSERVNALLRIALEIERKESLHKEAASFFLEEASDGDMHDAFQQGAMDRMMRDDD